jgi:hypothetical protein
LCPIEKKQSGGQDESSQPGARAPRKGRDVARRRHPDGAHRRHRQDDEHSGYDWLFIDPEHGPMSIELFVTISVVALAAALSTLSLL